MYRSNSFFYTLLGTVALLLSSPTPGHTAYSLWSGTVRGSPRIIGMSGAVIGLGDTYTGATLNPAGPSLLTGGVQAEITSSRFYDSYLTSNNQWFASTTTGILVPFQQYAVGIGVSTPFETDGVGGNHLAVHEIGMSISRSFLDQHLSFGLGLKIEQVQTQSYQTTQWRPSFGVLYRFPRRIYIGSSFSPGVQWRASTASDQLSIPSTVDLGAGWIPNRFFKVGVGLKYISSEANSFSFLNPAQTIGTSSVAQIHLGMSYQPIYTPQFSTTLYTGFYTEPDRGPGRDRTHWTGTIEVRPWFFALSAAIDTAQQYCNVLFGVGLNMKETLRTLKLLPREVAPPSSGLFPNPIKVSDDWLPLKLQDHPEDSFQSIDAAPKDYINSIRKGTQEVIKQIESLQR